MALFLLREMFLMNKHIIHLYLQNVLFTFSRCNTSRACRHVEFCILILLFHDIFGVGRISSVDSRTQFCDKSNSLELVPE